MSNLFKRTKIIATIGPAVNTPEQVDALIQHGVNVCRMNHSHGTFEERDQQIAWIRAAQAKKGRSVAILQDLQGPKIRLGIIKDNHMDVKAGDELILDFSVEEHDGTNRIPVQYNLAEKVKVGEPIFIFDGKIRTQVTEIESNTAIKVKVENDGFIMSRKGLNLPETDFGGDVITEKDLYDITEGAKRDYDYVAMSFVQTAEDIDNIRQILLSNNSTARVIAKIETKKAVAEENLEAIVEASDGIMVARGDMAVEVGAEMVPIIQQKIVDLCRKHSKICIVATQMMGSMTENPEPTRAEVSDVAHAVMQGVDAVMLSDETANGKYPLEAVAAMKKTILYTQNNSEIAEKKYSVAEVGKYGAIAETAARLAEQLGADIIVCQTSTGATAEAIAAARPNLPIISVTSNQRVANQLALNYANAAFLRDYSPSYAADLVLELKANGYLKSDHPDGLISAVIVSGSTNNLGSTDTIKYRQI